MPPAFAVVTAAATILVSAAPAAAHPDVAPIRRVVVRHRAEVRACYQPALRRDATSAGTVVVEFTIDGRGAVTRALIKRSTVRDGDVASCLVHRLRQWRFPVLGNGVPLIVNYPFVFKP